MPKNGPNSLNSTSKESVPLPPDSVFRIGSHEETEEWSINKKRYLKWVESSEDAQFAEKAGWAELPHHVDSEGFGYIEIPAGTRSAGSVLSGLEAWEGEKKAVLDFIVDYQEDLKRTTDHYDASVDLDTVAVSRDRMMFITPPHEPTKDVDRMNQWHADLMQDLTQVLATEPQKEELLADYQTLIIELGQGQ